VEALRDTPFRCFKPEGPYMLWVDCSVLGMNTAELWTFMKERARILPDLGSTFDSIDYAFYTESQTYMRLNVGMPRSMIRQAMENLKNAVNSL
jgi:cystathionine beta-lyase